MDWTSYLDRACEGINLDGFPSPDSLWKFWSDLNTVRPITQARKLFPSKPKGYVRATKDLACYAANKATAMKLRCEGEIRTATLYEDICEGIYNRLPEYAKW